MSHAFDSSVLEQLCYKATPAHSIYTNSVLDLERCIEDALREQGSFENEHRRVHLEWTDGSHVSLRAPLCRASQEATEATHAAAVYCKLTVVDLKTKKLTTNDKFKLGEIPYPLDADSGDNVDLRDRDRVHFPVFCVRGVYKVLNFPLTLALNTIVVHRVERDYVCFDLCSKDGCGQKVYVLQLSLNADFPYTRSILMSIRGVSTRPVNLISFVYDCDTSVSSFMAFVGADVQKMMHHTLRLGADENGAARKAVFGSVDPSACFFPQMESRRGESAKMRLLGLMVTRLLRVASGASPADEKRDLRNMRVLTPRTALTTAVGNGVRRVAAELARPGRKSAGTSLITEVERVISTGNLRAQGFDYTGVSDVFDPSDNVVKKLAAVRTVRSQGEVNVNTARHALVHPSSYGFLCCVETPNNDRAGRVTHFAATADVSAPCPLSVRDALEELLRGCCATPARGARGRLLPLLLDGRWIGRTELGADQLRNRVSRLPDFHAAAASKICVFEDATLGAVRVSSSAGRLCRPVLTAAAAAADVTASTTFADLIRDGVARYVDVAEAANTVVAPSLTDFRPDEHHAAEVSSASPYGVTALLCASVHNQGSRCVQGCVFLKQALQSNEKRLNMRIRGEQFGGTRADLGVLTSPLLENAHIGESMYVGVLHDGGANTDDAVVARSRKLLRTERKTVVKAQETRLAAAKRSELGAKRLHDAAFPAYSLAFVKPSLDDAPPTLDMDSYIVSEGQAVRPGDVVVCAEKDGVAAPIRSSVAGVVEDVRVVDVGLGVRSARVSVNETLELHVGDKIASPHGQKGVVACIRGDDMHRVGGPAGRQLDLLINPHAIPSRMTMGFLREMADSMPTKVHEMRKVYDPLSRGSSTASVGYVRYYRLKHLVGDKMRARRTGARDLVSNQAVSGRCRGGGLKMGEMEFDVLHAAGAAGMTFDRMHAAADGFVDVAVDSGNGQLLVGGIDGRSEGGIDGQGGARRVKLPTTTLAALMFIRACMLNVSIGTEPENST